MVLNPEVLTSALRAAVTHDSTTKPRPATRSRVVCVALSQASVRPPHDCLQLEELCQEAWTPVVDLFGIGRDFGQHYQRRELTLRVRVGLDIPQGVRPSRILVAGDLLSTTSSEAAHLLLFEAPLWQFDLVGEQVAAGHDVSKSKMGAKRSKAIFRLTVPPAGTRVDLNDEIIVGVTREANLSAQPGRG